MLYVTLQTYGQYGAQVQWIHLQNDSNILKEGEEKLQEPKDKGFCCEIVTSSNVRSNTC